MTTPAQWVNAGPDEAALPALLQRIAQRISVESIDELWIFPTRRAQGVESTVIVISTFEDPSPEELETGEHADPRDRNASRHRGEAGGGPHADSPRDRNSSPQRGKVGRGVLERAARSDPRDRRRVNIAHFTASRDRKGRATVDEKLELHAIAPAAAAARVVEGVIRRLDDDLAVPRSERIAGDPARWNTLLENLGAPRTLPLTPAGGR